MDRVSGHTFVNRFVGPYCVVVDLGANNGAFSRGMNERYGCSCVAIEPNPECFTRLAAMPNVLPFNLAIADRDGAMRFYVAENSEASSFVRTSERDREIEVRAVRLDHFARDQGFIRIDLLKVDIEGAEVPLFDSLPDTFFRDVGQIAVEFHDFCGLVLRDDVARIVRRLEGLGFLSINFSKDSHGHEDHLFINTAQCPVGRIEYLLIKYVTKNARGIGRILHRLRKQWHGAPALPAA